MEHGINFVELGARIVAARRRQRLKQYELASRAGLHPVTISRIEHGQMAGVTVEVVGRIARALNIPLHELLHWDTDESKSEPAGVVLVGA